MKRFGSFMASVAIMLVMFSGIGAAAGFSAAGQHDHGHMGTPEASPAAAPMMDHADHSDHGSTSTGAFYMTITNNGNEPDRLVSIESDAADTVEIHDVVMDGTVMQMVPQHDGLEIPEGEGVALEPGGYHVMMMGLTESLIAGEEFTATLTFENAGEVEITVPILRTEPDEDELDASPVEAGEGSIVIEDIWARHAPKLDGDTAPGTPVASPVATPAATPES